MRKHNSLSYMCGIKFILLTLAIIGVLSNQAKAVTPELIIPNVTSGRTIVESPEFSSSQLMVIDEQSSTPSAFEVVDGAKIRVNTLNALIENMKDVEGVCKINCVIFL